MGQETGAGIPTGNPSWSAQKAGFAEAFGRAEAADKHVVLEEAQTRRSVDIRKAAPTCSRSAVAWGQLFSGKKGGAKTPILVTPG